MYKHQYFSGFAITIL